MKKFIISAAFSSFVATTIWAQDNTFDKKFRFGIRIAPQPTWIRSNDKNTTRGSLNLGFGYGLITEFKLSDIIHLYTGIGGDFENGTINYKNDPSNNYEVGYVTDKEGTLVELSNGADSSTLYSASNVRYSGISSRKIKTTYVTIPLTIKMMTQEYNGMRYFAQFGADFGLRTKVKADDNYSKVIQGNKVTTVSGTNIDLDIRKDASLIPVRIGLNVGLGTEYRIAGTTSLMLSINYFTAFTNLMRNPSKYTMTGSQIDSNGKLQFTYLKQELIQNALRIHIGILF